MRIGILSDIHEAVAELQTALQLFESIGVDQVLCLGDIFDRTASGRNRGSAPDCGSHRGLGQSRSGLLHW